MLGFTGNPGNISISPINYKLSQVSINKDSSDGEDSGEEYHGMFWEDMLDSDQDGLPDIYEDDIGTNPFNPDTDNDNLPDGFEVLYSSTDPLNPSSLNNGITDDLLDPDEDGLTMYEEYLLSTDPLEADTDMDNLTDGDEVIIYNTDPLLFDTDGDSIGDGDEILLGLDPLNPSTHGYHDSQYESVHIIDSNNDILDNINADNINYQLELDITAKGSVYSDLFVRESAYSSAIDNINILGIIPEIILEDESKLESITLRFKLSPDNIYPEYTCTELKGLKRYNIFMYDEDLRFLFPVTTQFDEVNNELYTTVDQIGTFCVMDLEKWFSNMGIELVDIENFQSIDNFEFNDKEISEINNELTAVDKSYNLLEENLITKSNDMITRSIL